MNNIVFEGSDLARDMLAKGANEIWCAVSDNSDEEAMSDHNGNDFTARIVSFHEGFFYCTAGMAWSFAVPIKIVALTRSEKKLCSYEPC